MAGESVTIVAEFINYGKRKFRGTSCNINPITHQQVCLFFMKNSIFHLNMCDLMNNTHVSNQNILMVKKLTIWTISGYVLI